MKTLVSVEDNEAGKTKIARRRLMTAAEGADVSAAVEKMYG